MKNTQAQKLAELNSVELPDNSTFLVERELYKNSAIELISRQKEGTYEYFLTLGHLRISQIFKTKEELLQHCEDNNLQLMIILMTTIAQQIYDLNEGDKQANYEKVVEEIYGNKSSINPK